MIEAFAERWRRKQLDSGFGEMASNMVACGEDVLPDACAPFVSFKEAVRPRPIYEVYGSPFDWSSVDRERLAEYRMIGSDGAGNLICIEKRTSVVVLLDHEDWFRTRQFVNSSIRQLAECLLAYMGEHDPTRFQSAVEAIDPAALAEKSFWWHEAAVLGK
jgi:SUKH-4 immunity protein of toxin-antitoxin system